MVDDKDIGKLQEDKYEALSAPFPKSAYSKDLSRGSGNAFTSVKAQYIVERLNQVVGVHGWSLDGDFKELEEGILFIGQLNAANQGFMARRKAVGFASYTMGRDKKRLIGDVYKSAMTDALSKAASHIGIANDVYKGLIPVDSWK